MSKRLFAITGLVVLSVLLIAGIGGFIYYQSLKSTPQYSIALLIDAAKRDDRPAIEKLVDTNAVVDDFVPQVTGKAIELYGRGLPPAILARVELLAAPLLPAVKERARAELPRVIRERSERFGYVPFFGMVLGADRYLDIAITGDTAIVTSTIPERPMELKMKRSGEIWQIVGVTDEQLAMNIARTIGQEVIAIAMNGGKNTANLFGIGNLTDLLRQAEELVK